MSQIIYRKNAASPWIKQGDRLTKTFSSGLCLIQQTYIAPKALATYNAFVEGAAITDSQPCIDGAYIFPAPDYQDTGDGFMRCTVTAYGRINSTGNKTFSKELGLQDFSASFTPSNGGDVTFNDYAIQVTCDLLIWKFVTPKIASPNVTITDNLKIFRLNGSELTSVQISEFFSTASLAGLNKPTSVSFTTPEQITLAENTNYGAFDEWTVAYKAAPQEVSLGSWQRTGAPSKPANYNPVTLYNSLPYNGFNLLDVNNNGAVQVSVVNVENINAPSGGWNPSTPKTNVPLNNQSVGTYLGGSALVNDNRLFYTPPTFNRPAPVTVMNTSTPPEPYEVVDGSFTLRRKLKETRSDSSNVFYDYVWELVSVFENFGIQLTNENNQLSGYTIQVSFADPDQE